MHSGKSNLTQSNMTNPAIRRRFLEEVESELCDSRFEMVDDSFVVLLRRSVLSNVAVCSSCRRRGMTVWIVIC